METRSLVLRIMLKFEEPTRFPSGNNKQSRIDESDVQGEAEVGP